MRVEQSVLEVVIFMSTIRVEGKLHMPAGGRLTDYLALAERKFVPLTDAQVFLLPGNQLLHTIPFVSLNKDFIVFIFPKEN